MPRKTHGWGGTSEYHTWHTMLQRCHNPKATSYANYGGRGVKVCPRWWQFEAFLADMGTKPSAAHTLDRLDNAKGYEPRNVRWATLAEQGHNRRTNKYVEHAGIRASLAATIRRLGLPTFAVRNRIRRGWDVERALTTPVAVKR